MPFTPFHLGPGLAAKAVAGRRFSFLAFGLTQALIDLEPLYYLLRQEPPLHRFFHTLAGASVVMALALLLGRPACQWSLKWWDRHAAPPLRLGLRPAIPWPAAAAGAAFGAYSHVLLDSAVHFDVRPFAPFSPASPLYRAVGWDEMHAGCALAGAAGLALMLASRLRRGPARES